ncbi:DUF1049 domain-containing protein [Alkalibaculum sp. M08DMB]|uniref:DUF1049 domain-containing protein n=1 Tax=Alkalibaculum sporogenes TaxID=2655001 RepID=A0A6A7K9D7_9FIRM|nr:LapA family protein [Alkalibaculum sporogenes]MPW25723.1 DUF1049 domain-containing protein [Alkalibaculum sporogenes]
MSWKFVLTLFFALIVAIFAIQNATPVDVDFLFWNIYVSQALVILISAIFGAIITMLLSLIKQFRSNTIIKNERNTVTALETENKSLKEKLEIQITDNPDSVKCSDSTDNNNDSGNIE